MADFYRRALKKLDKLDTEQHRELLVSAVDKLDLLENVLDSIDVGILVCDGDNNLVMVNKYAQRLLPLNCSEGEQLVSAIDDERIAEFFRETLLNRDRVIDKEIDIDYKGRNRLFSVNVLPLVRDRRITGSLIYIEDITEKRKGEARLHRAENLASLTTLAAGLAHEIKNPLGSISIHLQLLQKTLAKINYTNNKTDKYFNVIKEEVDRLNRIVIDFLFAVRPMNIELREGDINNMISKMMEFVTVEMELSKILCLLELDEKVPKIMMDERLLNQVMLNLVKNAQSAMPKGGVLTIATNYADNEIRISICDTGIGISKENIAKIFEPYFTTKETGTGLGLTQVYKIIREHHGEITVNSAPDTGTEFKIFLPVPQKETRMIAYNEKISTGTEGAGK
ncbi:MAG: PAS domain S-box protein [Treponema sp.]|jgi:PAS domain S-box-containing protein|nr:PAS domain S-box protein [Treponema sp.]